MPLDLETTRLRHVAGKKVLCDGLYVNGEPGRLTGIMGPSGAGKSVLLKILAGYVRPQQGTIRVAGRALHRHYREIRPFLGYVPQTEIMTPELTAWQSLHYRLRLQCPSLSAGQRRQRIVETCQRLGLQENLDRLLHQRIGDPTDARGDHPSGGERRRINIAHELVNRPELLLLDEPTSGLSATDAETVVDLVRSLAVRDGLTVILTIHQPSPRMFGSLDDLLLISWGGRPAYYGRAARVEDYFESWSHTRRPPDRATAEYISDFVRDREIGNTAARAFEDALRSGTCDGLQFPPEEPLP